MTELGETTEATEATEASTDTSVQGKAVETKDCPYCSERIKAEAKKCRYCGELLDITLRAAEEARKATSSQVFMNAGGGAAVNSIPPIYRTNKSKTVAGWLALLLGGLGFHKFYLGKPFQGILYLLFCWTYIPMIIAFIEAIAYFTMSEEKFAREVG